MLKVFAPRRVIVDKKGIADGSLDEEDESVTKRLRRQVTQLTIGKAEVEKDLMNVLASIEKENNHEVNSMKDRIKATEEANTFLKVSKNSLVERILDLELKLVEGEEGNDTWNQDQVKHTKNLNSELTSSNVNIKPVQETIQQLDGKDTKDQITEEYNTLLEEKILIIVAREDATSKRLANVKQDADDSLLEQSKTIDALKEEVDALKEDKITLERELLSAMEKSTDGGRIELLTRQLEEKTTESINLHQKLEEKRKEVNELMKHDNDNATNLLEEQKIVKTDLEEQLRMKDTVIDQMATEKSADGGRIELLTRQLEEKTTESMNLHQNLEEKEKEKEVNELMKHDNDNAAYLLEEQKLVTTDLEEQLRMKDTVIDQMAQAANNLLSCQSNVLEQKYVEEIEGLKLELRQKNAKIECISFEKKHIVTSFKQRETDFYQLMQSHQCKLEKIEEKRKKYEAKLERTIDENEHIGNQNLHENNFQKNVLKHETCLQNQGLEILELRKSLQSQLVYIAKSEIEVNLKDFITKKRNLNHEEKNELKGILEEAENKCIVFKGQQKKNEKLMGGDMQYKIDKLEGSTVLIAQERNLNMLNSKWRKQASASNLQRVVL